MLTFRRFARSGNFIAYRVYYAIWLLVVLFICDPGKTLSAALVSGCLYGSINWSPDGKWLVFATRSEVILPAGWWIGADPGTESELPAAEAPMHTLWLCQVESRKCWSLASSRCAISSAAWSPDGRRLAYVRCNEEPGQAVSFEVIIQEGFEDRRVLGPLGSDVNRSGPPRGDAHRLALAGCDASVTWSPRGTFLAVPWLDPFGTTVLRVEDGSVAGTYPNAQFPSWTQDERRLALVMRGEDEGYHVTGDGLGQTLSAVATGYAAQPVMWDASGDFFHCIRWRDPPAGSSFPYAAELVRYDVQKRACDVVRSVITRRPSTGVDEPVRVYFARIPNSQSIIVVASSSEQSTDVLELNLDRQTPAQRNALLNPDLVCGVPSFGTAKHLMAMRFGSGQTLGVPAIYNVQSGELQAILPDHATQVLAVETIIERILHVYEESSSKKFKNPTARWVRLPSPGEMTAFALRDGRAADRIERLAGDGLRILDYELPGRPPALHQRALAEARMFLSYISNNHTAALRAADTVEPLLDSGRQRLGLAVVRAQCYIGLRQWKDAQESLTTLAERVARSLSGQESEPDDSAFNPNGTIRELLQELAEAEKR